jgi:hypothetical protein
LLCLISGGKPIFLRRRAQVLRFPNRARPFCRQQRGHRGDRSAATVVVATHELAHAYGHLGRDIDGKKWETEAFARADLNIVEGIAQFYTEVVSRKLETRNPPVLPAHQKLTEIQQGPYRVHEEWAKRKTGDKDTLLPQAGEIVRATLVQCRSRGVDDGMMMQIAFA